MYKQTIKHPLFLLIPLESLAAFASTFCLNCFRLLWVFIQTNFSLLFVLEVN